MSSSRGARRLLHADRRLAGPRPVRTLCAVACACLTLALGPRVVRAVPNSNQEFAEAVHSKASIERGAGLYQPCVRCHGATGGGRPDGLVPRIGGQLASVLQKQLTDYRHDRRWDPRMEASSDQHHLVDAQAIADVTAYVNQLRPREPSGHGSGDLLVHGAESYAHACASCHGGAAEGDAEHSIPSLAAQQYEYLRRQIYDAVDGRRPNFSRQHIRLLAQLDHADIGAICDYLSRLGAGRSPPRKSTRSVPLHCSTQAMR